MTAPATSGHSSIPRSAPGLVLAVAVCTASLAAAAELGALALQKYAIGQFVHHAGAHLLWMVPLADLLWIAPVALLIAEAHRRWPRIVRLSSAVALVTLLGWFGVFVLARHRVHILAIWALALGAAVQTGLLVERHAARVRRFVRIAVPVLLAWSPVSAVFVGAARAARERDQFARRPAVTAEDPPNVIIILLDTVRGLSLSLGNPAGKTSPGLDALAREGVLFTAAFAPSNWTPPSHASLFTGQWALEFPRIAARGMGTRFRTLAEHFAANGYATAGFSGNVIVNRGSGLTRGFAHFEDFPTSLPQIVNSSELAKAILRWRPLRNAIGLRDLPGRRYSDDIARNVLDWLDAAPHGPYFLFVNLFDAHAPYVPPPPFDTLFNPAGRDRRPALVEQLTLDEISPEVVAAERAAYEGSVAFMDQQVTRLVASLRERAILDNDILVVTSDHGEEFGEHGATGHGHTMYRELLQVPLLIIAPGHVPAGVRIDTPVSIADLAATLADLTGAPSAVFPGGSFRTLWSDPEAPLTAAPPRPAFSFWERSGSVVVGGFHFLRTGAGEEELYDLAADEGEQHDLAKDPAYETQLRRGRAVLDSIFEASSSAARPE